MTTDTRNAGSSVLKWNAVIFLLNRTDRNWNVKMEKLFISVKGTLLFEREALIAVGRWELILVCIVEFFWWNPQLYERRFIFFTNFSFQFLFLLLFFLVLCSTLWNNYSKICRNKFPFEWIFNMSFRSRQENFNRYYCLGPVRNACQNHIQWFRRVKIKFGRWI